jgi:MOSC domain-containing protein YiiM
MQLGLVSVNVAQPSVIGRFRGQPTTSAIGKQPVSAEWIDLGWANLEGDRQADLSVHGGPDKAVYAYPIQKNAYAAGWKVPVTVCCPSDSSSR